MEKGLAQVRAGDTRDYEMAKAFWMKKLGYHGVIMVFPIKTCAICGEEFELKPGKPGLAIHCPSCSEEENQPPGRTMDADERRMQSEADAERRKAIRNLLYRKDS